jgi:hypothetical protein
VGALFQRGSGARVAVVAALAAGGLAAPERAAAAPQYELVPSLSFQGGADTNVLFDGQGGDRVGRGTLRLRMDAHDRDWGLRADVAGGVLAFDVRDRVVPLAEGTFRATRRFTRGTKLLATARLRGADDPLSLAQLGVLAGGGLTLGWRSRLELEHRLDRRWSVGAATTFDGVHFFDPAFADTGGLALGGRAFGRWRANRWLALVPGVEARTYQGSQVGGTSVGVVPGLRMRVARRTFLDVAGGPVAFLDAAGAEPLAVGRAAFTYDGRGLALSLMAAQDLLVPSGRGGVTFGQLVEGLGRWGTESLELRARAGGYRTHPDPRSDVWVPGYGLEAGAFARVAPVAWVGVSAMHFARLPAGGAPGMTREAVYLRLELGGGRP